MTMWITTLTEDKSEGRETERLTNKKLKATPVKQSIFFMFFLQQLPLKACSSVTLTLCITSLTTCMNLLWGTRFHLIMNCNVICKHHNVNFMSSSVWPDHICQRVHHHQNKNKRGLRLHPWCQPTLTAHLTTVCAPGLALALTLQSSDFSLCVKGEKQQDSPEHVHLFLLLRRTR